MHNKNYRSKTMFPNYCFTRSAKEPGYEVKRCYLPKESHLRLHYQHCGNVRINNRNADSSISSALRDLSSKRVKRLRKPKKSNSNRRIDNESGPCKIPPPSRSVEFRFPPVVCEMPDKEEATNRQGEDALASTSDGPRESGGGHESGDRNKNIEKECEHQENVTEVPHHDPNRDLQESCADFFSIIHDNVLEAVQGAVQGMIAKCFENTVAHIAHLSAELSQQKSLLNKLYREVTELAEQNETNLNQFKFLTQMLIDNQTIHYRTLNQCRNEKRDRVRDRDKDRRRRSTSSSTDHQSRSTGGESFKSKVQQQHKLWQQQQPNVYYRQVCQKCSNQDTNGKLQPKRSCAKSTTVKRLAKGVGTVSMPDLARTQSTWATSKIRKIHTPIDAGGSPQRQPSRHRFFTTSRSSSVRRQPSFAHLPPTHRPQRSVSKVRRKPSQQFKGERSLEDVRPKGHINVPRK
ncbi:uncharacterized protein [Drosophila tropicalis]|uniref:uncharacterized protein isoform X2 n=1 Tax=Drosophila tropicalis TaxID=46794 RepID=UPI0035ABB1FF